MRISEYIFVTGSAHQDAYYNPFSLLFPPPPSSPSQTLPVSWAAYIVFNVNFVRLPVIDSRV